MGDQVTEQPARSASIAALAGALAKAQGAIKGASKDANNPFFKTKYADLSSVWDACRGPLSANGLSVIQLPRRTPQGVEVETILAHSSGEWIANVLPMPVSKADAQGVGSAITYARRYALASIVGVAPEDDDGNAAVGGGTTAPAMKRPAAKGQPQKPEPRPQPEASPTAENPATAQETAPAAQPEEAMVDPQTGEVPFDDLGEESQGELTVVNCEYRDGNSGGKKVRVYLITCSDKKLYSTMSEPIFKDAEIALAEKLPVLIKAPEMKQSGTTQRWPIVEFQVVQ